MAATFGSKDATDPLEQYLLLAKTAKGPAAVDLIKQVLESRNVFSFQKLMIMPNIKELQDGPYQKYYSLLKLFAHDTYLSYLNNKDKLPELTSNQVKKLRLLSIVSAGSAQKYIPFPSLLKQLDLSHVKDMEDLVTEAIYIELIKGKLNYKDERLEVHCCIGREIEPFNLKKIEDSIDTWLDIVGLVLTDIDIQIKDAVIKQAEHITRKLEVENQIEAIKKQIKLQAQEEMLMSEKAESLGIVLDKTKKSLRTRSNRGNGKFITH